MFFKKFIYIVSLVAECPPCEGLSLTADPVEAGAKPPCMVLSKAELQLWPWVGRVTFFHPFAFCLFLQYFLPYQA